MAGVEKLTRYGVASPLAERTIEAGLGASKIRALARADLVSKFGLSVEDADELKKCLVRQAIDKDVMEMLLERSNHTCCLCKGVKSHAIIIHHIVEYKVSQDNSYANLAVLCPSDHDRAHRPGGLSLGLSVEQIRNAKRAWEQQVELHNVQQAARAIEINDEAIDYINIKRIEDMCVRRFGAMPTTGISAALQRSRIIDDTLRFDEKFVRKNLSGGSYLFDYINSSETEHYRQLLVALAEVVHFEDLGEAARSGVRKLQALVGKHVFFIGGVTSLRPSRPITRVSEGFAFVHKTRKAVIRWDADPNYLMSSSSISRQGQVNHYIIYGLVRTVHKPSSGHPVQVTCSPLLVAQPSISIDRTPNIAYQRRSQTEVDDDENDGFFDD